MRIPEWIMDCLAFVGSDGCHIWLRGGIGAGSYELLDRLMDSIEFEPMRQFGRALKVDGKDQKYHGGPLYRACERLVERTGSCSSSGNSFGISTGTKHCCRLRASTKDVAEARVYWRDT